MCVAIGQRRGASALTEEELRRGWAVNPDGGGYAFIDEKSGRLMIRKFMERDPFIKAYHRDHSIHGKTSPFLVHMRITTHGGTSKATAHPFRVSSEDGEMAFIHNGMIDEVSAFTQSGVSDTMAFRDMFLNDMPDSWLDNMAIRDLVEHFIGWSKLVFITNSKKCQDELYIINESAGSWKGETWFSNNSCEKPKPYTYVRYVKGTKVTTHSHWWNDDNDDDLALTKAWDEVAKGRATSLVVREKMNDLLVSEGFDDVLEVAIEQGYCEFCLFKPCRCATTCFYCNATVSECTCDSKDEFTIDDMRLWVGDGFLQAVRKEEIEAELEAYYGPNDASKQAYSDSDTEVDWPWDDDDSSKKGDEK